MSQILQNKCKIFSKYFLPFFFTKRDKDLCELTTEAKRIAKLQSLSFKKYIEILL